jgi:sulfur carrier protein
MTVKLKINGKPEESGAATIAELVVERGLIPGRIVFEHNGVIIQREHWAATGLSEGDSLEIIQFVGGG